MTNKDTAFKIIDYLVEIVSFFVDNETKQKLQDDIRFHETNKYFYLKNDEKDYEYKFSDYESKIEETNLFRAVNKIDIQQFERISELNQFFIFLLLQLINDLYHYKVQVDHVMPVINRFKAKQKSIERIFGITPDANLWGDKNIVVLNLRNVNLDMRKTIPLLLAKNIYTAHKKEENKKTLSIIIDEAHNILSKTSFRETEDWKDYRRETFEEIIKE